MNTHEEKEEKGIEEHCDEPEKIHSCIQSYKKQPFLLLLTMICEDIKAYYGISYSKGKQSTSMHLIEVKHTSF